jgi:Tol biopolymer transport system component
MDLWQVSVDPEGGERQGTPRLVYPRLPRGSSFDISADARTLAFTGGPNKAHIHLFELGEDGTGIIRHDTLTRGTGWNVGPALSPSGRKIVFLARTTSGVDLYVADVPDGTPTRLNLLPRPKNIWSVVWSPEETHLAADTETEAGPRIALIDVEDGTMDLLEHEVVPGPVQIGWSSDGQSVLAGSPDGGYRFVQELTTNEQRRLFESLGGELIYALFSSDGAQVLVHEAGTNTLWVDSVDGGALRRGGQLPGIWPRPVWWGPDGTVRVLDLSGKTLTAMPWEGGTPQLLAELPVQCVHEGYQSMSADGRLLACAVREWESDVTVVENFDPMVITRASSPGG